MNIVIVNCDITIFVIPQIWGKNQSTSCTGYDISIQKWQVIILTVIDF